MAEITGAWATRQIGIAAVMTLWSVGVVLVVVAVAEWHIENAIAVLCLGIAAMAFAMGRANRMLGSCHR